MPVVDDFGVRVGLGGGASRATHDPEGVLSDRDFVGSVDLSLAGFWRDSEHMQLGGHYSISFGFASTTPRDRYQRVSVFGSFFLGRFDIGGSVAYTRSDQTTTPFEFVISLPAHDSYSNGVNLGAGSTWYATD